MSFPPGVYDQPLGQWEHLIEPGATVVCRVDDMTPDVAERIMLALRDDALRSDYRVIVVDRGVRFWPMDLAPVTWPGHDAPTDTYLRCEDCRVILPVLHTPEGPCDMCGGRLLEVRADGARA